MHCYDIRMQNLARIFQGYMIFIIYNICSSQKRTTLNSASSCRIDLSNEKSDELAVIDCYLRPQVFFASVVFFLGLTFSFRNTPSLLTHESSFYCTRQIICTLMNFCHRHLIFNFTRYLYITNYLKFII